MSRRSDIVDEIKTRLEAITVANGYQTTVKLVSEELRTPEECKASQIPALFIIDTDEDKVHSDVRDMDSSLQIIISGYVHDMRNPQTKQRKLLADVEKALTSTGGNPDYKLGGTLHIEDVLPAQIKTDRGSMKPFALFDFTFVIEYFQEYGTP